MPPCLALPFPGNGGSGSRAAHVGKRAIKSPSQRVRLFSGAPLFDPHSDGSDADNKRKQKSARKRAPFCLELLAGLVRSRRSGDGTAIVAEISGKKNRRQYADRVTSFRQYGQ